jgi:phenolic acid decarboxylase
MMSDPFESTRPEQLTRFLGKHFIYTYENGWQYEMYLKNARTIDYRIHSGMVGGRWVRDQQAHIVRLSDDICKISWDEPTGTTVSAAINFTERQLHGVIFFPQWVAQDPKKAVCSQDQHLDLMRQYRDAGPTYPEAGDRRIRARHVPGGLWPRQPGGHRLCPVGTAGRLRGAAQLRTAQRIGQPWKRGRCVSRQARPLDT